MYYQINIIMSTALASARKRRAPPQPTSTTPTSTPTSGQMQANAAGLTLPQVISLVDRRLIALETFVKNQTSAPARSIETDGVENVVDTIADIPSNLTEVLEEYNSRFDILAEEIANIKNIVLNLQSYTMDVNKVLMQDRIRILSEDTTQQSTQTLEEALDFGSN